MMEREDPYIGNKMNPPTPVALESIRITLDLYRSGKSGINYQKLQKFTEPILSHYQIELGVGFEDAVSVQNMHDMTLLLDILETATIFWEYCALNEATKSMAFKNLQESLLGPNPSSEDLAQFPILVASMEKTWGILSAGETASDLYQALDANSAENAVPMPSENGTASYGPEHLDTPEAFALFARPILDNDALYEDPDFLDEAMSRAQAYWDLAHQGLVELEDRLNQLASRFSTASLSPNHLKEEAQQMIQRFHELFPERK